MTIAPALVRYSIVGMDERIRVSSVMVLPSKGTFRSQRTRTFLPLRSEAGRSLVQHFVAMVVVWCRRKEVT